MSKAGIRISVAGRLMILLFAAMPCFAGSTLTSGIITVNSVLDDDPASFCTLRQAIALLNGTGSTGNCIASGTETPPEIRFDVPLPNTVTLTGGDLVPTTSVLIQGLGQDQLAISGNSSSQIFYMTEGSATLFLRDITLRDGVSPSGFPGGAIETCCGVGLDLARVTIQNSRSDFAGGAIKAGGETIIRDSRFTGNSAVQLSGTFLTFGGALYLESTTLLERVVIENNVSGSTTGGSTPGLGGALATTQNANVTLIDSTIRNNMALGDTQITNFNPKPAGLGGEGGGLYNTGVLTLIRSTVSNNMASFGGGGIFNVRNLGLFNSTVALNGVPGAASPSIGGGIENFTDNFFGGVSLRLVNSTLYGNSAASGGGLHNVHPDAADVLIDNTALGFNGSGQAGGDIVNADGGLLSGLNSLVESGGSSGGLSNGVDGNIVGVSAQFEAFGNFGGETGTVRFSETSPLIDAGSNALAVDPDALPLTTDQRNFSIVPRIINGTVDIGSIEYAGGILFIDGFEEP